VKKFAQGGFGKAKTLPQILAEGFGKISYSEDLQIDEFRIPDNISL